MLVEHALGFVECVPCHGEIEEGQRVVWVVPAPLDHEIGPALQCRVSVVEMSVEDVGTLQGLQSKGAAWYDCLLPSNPARYSARASAYRPIRSKTCPRPRRPGSSRDRSPRLTVSRDRFVEPAVHTSASAFAVTYSASFGRSLWACGRNSVMASATARVSTRPDGASSVLRPNGRFP